MRATEKARKKFTVVGAGLGGSLMASYLARAGHQVEVYERRDDPRRGGRTEGRSINLAISTRGIHAMEQIGLASKILGQAVPMRGRMIHSTEKRLTFQPYGTERHHYINSVSRAGLNLALIEAAGSHPNVRLVFGKKCTGVDAETATAYLEDTGSGEKTSVEGDVVVGADGAFSAVCRQLLRLNRFNYQQAYLKHGYKELTIPPGSGGSFQMEKNALHIWPRGGYMMIALPNQDGSFTCTLFWPFDGPNSFGSIKNEEDLLRFFRQTFADAVPMMPILASEFFENPTGSLVTIRCHPWCYRDKVVLLGDACHAVVPFYGQGANASFEDCTVLDECIRRHDGNLEEAFAAYNRRRKVHTDALADLALHNFIEMRDHVASKTFLLKKKVEHVLNRVFRRFYLPLYTMITFTRIPYADAVRKERRQRRLLLWSLGAVALLVILTVMRLS